MENTDTICNAAGAAEQVKHQRALVVSLAKAKRFEELPAAHQILRQMEDALKLMRAGSGPG